jgi:manganese/zinc/iron transport system permease protein
MNGGPELADWWRVLLLQDYNTRIVLMGALLLGCASGVIGTFALLRRRALVGDAASHATLPGIALAFMVMTALGGDGKFLPGLLAGAALAGLAGMGCILAIRRYTRLQEDAALGVVLSVFFGFGMALLGVIQRMRAGHAAGLESFIYGKTASMLAADAWLIAGIAGVVILVTLALFKELSLLCFDPEYAQARGYPVLLLDATLMVLMVLAVVTGLQAVGLILIIALLIIPVAAARFWTNDLGRMVRIAAGIGAASGVLGAVISAGAARIPAGAVMVLVAGFFFLFSLFWGPARGVWYRWRRHCQLKWKTGEQHVLRLLYEWEELSPGAALSLDDLWQAKTWTAHWVRRVVARAVRKGWVQPLTGAAVRLTAAGRLRARQVVRNHRLWEAYLIRYAHVAAHHVDRNADMIEHVLGDEMVAELERLEGAGFDVKPPPSPHPLNRPSYGVGGA